MSTQTHVLVFVPPRENKKKEEEKKLLNVSVVTYDKDAVTESLFELLGNETNVVDIAPQTMVENDEMHALVSCVRCHWLFDLWMNYSERGREWEDGMNERVNE